MAALSSCSSDSAQQRQRLRTRVGRTSRSDGKRRRLRDEVPFQPAPSHDRAIVGCRERMSAWPKLIADRTEHRTEARRVPQTLEPLQTSLRWRTGWCEFSTRLFWRQPRRWEPSASRRLSPSCSSPDDRSRGRAEPFAVPSRVCVRSALRRARSGGVEPERRAPRQRHRRHATTAAPSLDHQTEFIEVPDVGAYPSAAPQSSGVSAPNRRVQRRIASWETSIPRASINSETSRRLTPKR